MNTAAGTVSQVNASFDTNLQKFTWNVSFGDGVAKNTNGYWLVVGPGPLPRGTADEYAPGASLRDPPGRVAAPGNVRSWGHGIWSGALAAIRCQCPEGACLAIRHLDRARRVTVAFGGYHPRGVVPRLSRSALMVEPHVAERLLTPAEVAALFRVDPKTVTRWAKAGKLNAIRTLGGHRRYRESEVKSLIAGSTH